ncbi:MAG: DUF5721 family protein [Defluviitaleaceae bacterium]|nr:DUF5721 family protein [Defluviitaleaceae bacterium]MCL2273993.1 DUF5721 family protein [Defluviitaleaceae bacterium]MCL2274106.1 DUF5721 family protein [Defluviitaleaceae bacterium]
MLSLALPPAAVKNFMGQLLRETQFDFFAVRNVELTLATHISISGLLETEGEEAPGKKKYTSWGELRPLVYDLIKRATKPKLIKIVFSHPAPVDIHTNAAALFLNMTYEGDRIIFTTATSQQSFALEKTLDTAWDEWVQTFFINKNISVENNLGDDV